MTGSSFVETAVGITEQDATRRYASISEFALDDHALALLMQETINVFVTARLLTITDVGGTVILEVSHEALIREWPRLAEWLREALEDIRLQQSISEDVMEWLERGKPEDRLYRGTQLIEARAWAQRNVPSTNEAVFLHASEAEQNRQVKVERARLARELTLERLAVRRQRYVFGMSGITAIIVIAALVAVLLMQAQLLANYPLAVTNLNDSGPGSLRKAISKAKDGASITFARNLQGTIRLSSGPLDISKNLTISGPGAPILVISGSDKVNGLIDVNNSIVTITNLTIMNGHAWPDSTTAGSAVFVSHFPTLPHGGQLPCFGCGGGIYSQGRLTIIQSSIFNNSAVALGGGIEIGAATDDQEDSQNVNITYSTIDSNTANTGGGIDIYNPPFSGNNSSNQIWISGSIVAANAAATGPDLHGTFIFTEWPNLIQNTSAAHFVFDNVNSSLPLDCYSIFGISPKLGPLQNTGGVTLTQALLSGSPAIDRIPYKDCKASSPWTDQRGVQRPQGNECDLGAYEFTG